MAIPSCALTPDGVEEQRQRQVILAPSVASRILSSGRLVVDFRDDYDRQALDDMIAVERECYRTSDDDAYQRSADEIRAYSASAPDALLIPTHDDGVWRQLDAVSGDSLADMVTPHPPITSPKACLRR